MALRSKLTLILLYWILKDASKRIYRAPVLILRLILLFNPSYFQICLHFTPIVRANTILYKLSLVIVDEFNCNDRLHLDEPLNLAWQLNPFTDHDAIRCICDCTFKEDGHMGSSNERDGVSAQRRLRTVERTVRELQRRSERRPNSGRFDDGRQRKWTNASHIPNQL